MAKRKGIVPAWSQQFAYCVGLIVSDGNLSNNGRHIVFTSKDLCLAEIFREGLDLKVKIGKKARGGELEKKYYRVQFGNTNLYEYLVSIGITPKKSLTIEKVNVDRKYFWDFLRGCIDGDGNISVSLHPESKHPQLKVRLVSGSRKFLEWIKDCILKNTNISSGWIHQERSIFALVYAKKDSIVILKEMYKSPGKWYLPRKKEIANQFLS